MSIKSPGDALPCSIPQANAEKLRSIGAKPPVGDTKPTAAGDDNQGSVNAPDRSLPVPSSPTVGAQVDLNA
jgi:hypothetical protein